MLTHVNLNKNVESNLGHPFDCTEVTKFPVLNSRYVKIIVTRNCRNNFSKCLRTLQETEQTAFPRKCLGTAKNQAILTTTGIQHLVKVNR